MKIETIYAPGDIVWTMINNHCVETQTKSIYFDEFKYRDDIRRRSISLEGSFPEPILEDYFGWELEAQEGFWSMLTLCRRRENQLFKTKEELLASL